MPFTEGPARPRVIAGYTPGPDRLRKSPPRRPRSRRRFLRRLSGRGRLGAGADAQCGQDHNPCTRHTCASPAAAPAAHPRVHRDQGHAGSAPAPRRSETRPAGRLGSILSRRRCRTCRCAKIKKATCGGRRWL